MNSESKLEKARKIVELTGVRRGNRDRNTEPSEKSAKSPRASFKEDFINMQIELRAKHMSEAQLDALLDFYQSDMGQSIIEAQEQIKKETEELMAKKMGNSNSLGVSIDKPNDENDT